MRLKNSIGESIVSEFVRLEGLSADSIIGNDNFKLPRIISAGVGRTIQISGTMDDLIGGLAACLRESRPQLAKTVKRDEWHAWVRKAVGPALLEIDLLAPINESGASLIDAIEATLENQLLGLVGQENAFGATIFSNSDIPPFSVGPVKIESNTDWLYRKHFEGHITTTTARRIRKSWSGVRINPRKRGFEATREKNILDAISGSTYVVRLRTH